MYRIHRQTYEDGSWKSGVSSGQYYPTESLRLGYVLGTCAWNRSHRGMPRKGKAQSRSVGIICDVQFLSVVFCCFCYRTGGDITSDG